MRKFFSIFGLLLTLSANAQHWDTLRGGIGDWSVRVMYADTFDNYLYAAGMFNVADGKHCKGIARWDGTQWDSLGRGIDGLDPNTYPQNTHAITRYNNELYVGGDFASAGNVSTPCLAKWNGSTWDSLSVKPFASNWNEAILTLAPINGKLYIGGIFDTVAGIPCEGIAQWNGTNWSSINFPFFQNAPSVNAIAEYNGELYAAGEFCNTIGDTISNILRWNGSTWRSVGGGIKGAWTGISSMVVYNGELYVAGAFFQSDGNAGSNIQKWNGTSWSNVGGSTGGGNGQIIQIFICNGKLYAVGDFTIAGGIPAEYIASWDGTNWCGLGSTFDNLIGTGCEYKDTLFVGGGFQTIDGDTIIHIAQWIGGNYTAVCGNTTGLQENNLPDFSMQVFPNPANDLLSIKLKNVSEKHFDIKIVDVLGQTMIEKKEEDVSGNFEKQVDISTLSEGIYMVIVSVGEKKSVERIVVQR